MSTWTERLSLAGKRACVTGGSQGIGAEICGVLADAGADIAAVALDQDGLDNVAEVVRGHGRECATITADFTTVDGTREAAKKALEAFGAVDILVNCAGIAPIGPLLETSIRKALARRAQQAVAAGMARLRGRAAAQDGEQTPASADAA
jgi:NAD(P)-dependent dehydrogenase (short-subunit alcohol dehydrogenase family)